MTSSTSGPGRLITSRLDPILRPVGFAIGSLNPDSVLFCGPPETAARFPWIAESYGDQNVTCVDVMIEATDADGITRADFEVSSLDVLLDALGETELATSVRDRHRLAFADQLELTAARLKSSSASVPEVRSAARPVRQRPTLSPLTESQPQPD